LATEIYVTPVPWETVLLTRSTVNYGMFTYESEKCTCLVISNDLSKPKDFSRPSKLCNYWVSSCISYAAFDFLKNTPGKNIYTIKRRWWLTVTPLRLLLIWN